MYISRVYIKNYRSFQELDLKVKEGVTCVIGENNSGKSNLLHALRLVLDINLASSYRSLRDLDINNSVKIENPNQVIISVEFKEFEEDEYQDALVGSWVCEEDDIARITYRFRPSFKAREKLDADPFLDLSLDDYSWEIIGGGDKDPKVLVWDEDYGNSIRFSDLQQYKVIFLPALRDSKNDFRGGKSSPLDLILSQKVFDDKEKKKLVEILQKANHELAEDPIIKSVGTSIEKGFNETVGNTFGMEVKLGVVEPSFKSLTNSKSILLSNEFIKDFDLQRNSLGVNNVLFISMLLEYFKTHVKNSSLAGHLLLIEEPEAHLHPQLQRILYDSLDSSSSQSILTTHSTFISGKCPIESMVSLTYREGKPIGGKQLIDNEKLDEKDCKDLERYLDATKSTLLMARKVLLVEGPAELFLIPSLVKDTMGIDLDREGITIIPIFGKHFTVYAKLFGDHGLEKKCAILTDGDLPPQDEDDSEIESLDELKAYENKYLKIFACNTTFEREVLVSGTTDVFEATLKKFKKKKSLKLLKEFVDEVNETERKAKFKIARDAVLKSAIAVGKARFAQEASLHTKKATKVPDYIKETIEWLLK